MIDFLSTHELVSIVLAAIFVGAFFYVLMDDREFL